MDRVILVGVGALGSHLALLARNWDATLVLVDFDRVERKNLLAQLHTRLGVGRNKARAMQQTLHGLFGVRVDAVPHRLGPHNIEALLDGATLALDCVDDGPTRRLLADTCVRRGLPCLHGALAADGAYARVQWAPGFVVDDAAEGAVTCEDGEHLPFVARVAAVMAEAAQRHLDGGPRDDFHVRPAGLERI